MACSLELEIKEHEVEEADANTNSLSQVKSPMRPALSVAPVKETAMCVPSSEYVTSCSSGTDGVSVSSDITVMFRLPFLYPTLYMPAAAPEREVRTKYFPLGTLLVLRYRPVVELSCALDD